MPLRRDNAACHRGYFEAASKAHSAAHICTCKHGRAACDKVLPPGGGQEIAERA